MIYCSFPISGPLLEELRFWFHTIDTFNGYRIKPKLSPGAVFFFLRRKQLLFWRFQVRLNDHPVLSFCPLESQQSLNFWGLKTIFYINKDDRPLNSAKVFVQLDCKWGSHSINRFVSQFNAQVPILNCKFNSQGCSAADVFYLDWQGENNWLCPPVSLVKDVIRIVPEWLSAFFSWPLHEAYSI